MKEKTKYIEENYLKPIFEDVKSYYEKATIKKYYNKNNIIIKYELLSYNTSILYLENSKIYFNYKDINNKKIYTHTTLRHIKEFLKQKYYYLESNYKNILDKEKITKNDIKKLMED